MAKKILYIVIAAVFGGGLWYFFRAPVKVDTAITPNGSPPPFTSPVKDGERIFASYLLKFSVNYPEDLKVKEYSAGNTSTITFEDAKGEKGFQVFVVPYAEQTVSAERFKMDVPSGVMKDAMDVTIDGVKGTAFWSANNLFGETREVWFIHGGFLYEITTYKDLDPWLAHIMTTWHFF